MSTNQLSSCLNDSTIPLPKRVLAESRRSKGSTHLPELRKYINTIIKASNECDFISEPDREKFRKEKKFGRYSMFKGHNNKIKYEKIRVDMNSSRRKNITKANTSMHDSINGDDTTTSSSFVSGFEDPRNWKFNKIQNSNFSLKVERFLKELYPNPYHLDSLTEFCDSKIGHIDGSAEDMLMDELITRDNTKTQANIRNNDLITAVVEINSNKGEKKFESPQRLANSEQFFQTQSTEKENTEPLHGLKHPEMHLPQKRQHSRIKIQNFQSNTSSSLESVTSNAESVQNLEKISNSKVETNSRELLERVRSRVSTSVFGEEITDCDIGKLKLLSGIDIEATMSRKIKESKIKTSETDVFLKATNSKIYEQEEFNDVRKIHEVMNKANKSFLLISEKSQSLAAVVPEKLEREENFVETSSKGPDKEVRFDVKKPKSEERQKYVVIRNDHEATSSIKSKMNVEGSSKASVRVSVTQRELPKFKNEPGRYREIEIISQTRDFPRTALGPKQAPNNTDQGVKENTRNEDTNTSQKIGEVLEFMYDCLMKFSSSEDLMPEEGCNSSLVRRIFSSNQIVQPTTSKVPDETEGNPSVLRKAPPQQVVPGSTGETTRKRNRMRSRRSEFAMQINKQDEVLPPVNTNVEDQQGTHMNSEANNEPYPPTVETQNELGGYAEDHFPLEHLRLPKPVYPLPGKLNKSRTDARSLKEVLETEEKLFAREFSMKERIENVKQKESVTPRAGDECRINETSSSYSLPTGIKCPNSNFVICVNSLPRNLKTFTAVTPVIAIPKCPPMPLLGIKESRDIKPMACKSEFCLKQLYEPRETSYQVLTCTYRLKQGSVFKMNKLSVEYNAVPICEKTISSTFTESESSLKKSECFVRVSVKSLTKPPKVGKISRSSLTIPNTPALMSSTENAVNYESEDERRVESIVEAIEDAEGRILLLQQINESCRSASSIPTSSCRANQDVQNESLENDLRSKTDKKKVHDLLMRTYNLQIKLQDCLNKITRLHPSLQQCPTKSEESKTDVNASVSNNANLSDTSMIECNENRKKSLPLVHWYPVSQHQSQQDQSITISQHQSQQDESVTVSRRHSHQNEPIIVSQHQLHQKESITVSRHHSHKNEPIIVSQHQLHQKESITVSQHQSQQDESIKAQVSEKVDHGTSYNPPTERRSKTTRKESSESQSKETEKECRNTEDDTSSICSFKSSIDISEDIDVNVKKESKSRLPENMSKKEFYKKVYGEIELIRHIFEAENRQKEHSQAVKESNLQEEQNKNSLVQYDPKTPSKTLKTVFRGRESSTELTIGLKDIPMTQVRNISVEKTKLTPNHTKISICISKDKTSDMRMRSASSEIIQNKFPPYCYRDIGRSLKGTPSEEDDEVSKSSRSLNGESEDDEDYKSVASTFDELDPYPDLLKPEPKESKLGKAPLPKKTPEHRFDFYQKMNTNAEEAGTKPKALSSSVCRFKELEPLKQAMTEMQIRMRSIKRDALFNGNDYYKRALKLAKMSAGYCQSCGNRSVIPNDTFGYYKSLVPRRCSSRGIRHYKASVSSDPSFYSFHSSNADVGEHFCDFDVKHNSYLLNRTSHSNRTILRGSLHDMPVLFERI